MTGFSELDGVTEELAEALVGEGFLSYDDLSVIEPDDLMAMGDLTAEQVDSIVEQAETKAEEAEKARREAEEAIRFDPKSHQVIPSLDPKEGAVGTIFQWQAGKRVVVFPESIAMGEIKLPPWMK